MTITNYNYKLHFKLLITITFFMEAKIGYEQLQTYLSFTSF